MLSENGSSQKVDCITLDNSQKKLYLNGDNYRLIDNALRCLKLNSIAEEQDSLIRIWMLEIVRSSPDTPGIAKIKMFEFGKHGKIPTAILNTLQWQYDSRDSSFSVTCIKKEILKPNKGWLFFEEEINNLKLPKLYQKPLKNVYPAVVDAGMLVFQFLYGHNTFSVDFTGYWAVSHAQNDLQKEQSIRISSFIYIIKKHFGITL